MTGTYRHTMVFTYDGFEHTRRRAKTRAKHKPIDRRIKRREHHDVTREAVYSYYADGADDLYDHLYGDDYMDDYFASDDYLIETDYGDYEDYIEEYDYSYDFYDYGYDPYDDGYFPSYAPRPAYDPMQDYSVQREDVGRSLGEILSELTSKRRIQNPSRPEDGSLDGGDWMFGDIIPNR